LARRKRRSRRGGSARLIIATVCLAVPSPGVVGAHGWLRFKAASNVPLGQASRFPGDRPKAGTALFLDVTQPIPLSADLRNQFQKIVADVPVGGAIDIYALTEKEGELIQTFHGCNPGSGANVDEWTSNPRLAQARWEKGFQKPLTEIAGKLTAGESGRLSPIMAAIQKINLEVFANAPAGIPKRLYIASDMLEHTPAFSNYRDGASYQKYQHSPANDRFRTSLDGVTVKILAFQRPNIKFTMEDLANFWAQWIKGNNGYFDGFVRLEGIR